MALPVAFVLLDLPADLIFQLYMTVSVLIGVLAVVQNIPTLSIRVQLSYLNTPLNRWKG